MTDIKLICNYFVNRFKVICQAKLSNTARVSVCVCLAVKVKMLPCLSQGKVKYARCNCLKKLSTRSAFAYACIPIQVYVWKCTVCRSTTQKAITGEVRGGKCTVFVCFICAHLIIIQLVFKAGVLWVNAAFHFVVMNGDLLIEVPEALWGFKSISWRKCVV